ncbi:hypothetical protein [Antrihabitans cavernicola]|uniref:Lipoprotein n=1 Tax=Antrihabitans cavernicola TaxID=2495913 RepID=A0A5A7SDV1_9NOCA|nr:hypothetical protein [Spelaeibacter cavernicola]KAA0023724.1 hypothetical protein FOY51_03685 [Spelaeibacter cavernicola]
MRRIVAKARSFYGEHPLHLLALIACFALFGYIVATLGLKELWNPDKWWQSIGVWFLAAVIGHDLLLFPLYAIADRSLTVGLRAVRGRLPHRARLPVSPLNYIRTPLLGCALTGVMFLPGIIEQGKETYLAATGLTQEPYFARWLLICAALFGVSAVAYAVRLGVSGRAPRRPTVST